MWFCLEVFILKVNTSPYGTRLALAYVVEGTIFKISLK